MGKDLTIILFAVTLIAILMLRSTPDKKPFKCIGAKYNKPLKLIIDGQDWAIINPIDGVIDFPMIHGKCYKFKEYE